MRNLALLGARAVLGSYLAAHGAQKLWGSLGGPGIDAAGKGFEAMGLKPGKQFATLAGASEFSGGILTATGALWPIGPVSLVGAMSVASVVHRKAGPFAQQGGFELPLTNAALALTLIGTGPGALRIPIKASTKLRLLSVLGGAALSGYSISKILSHKPEAPAEPAPAAARPAASAPAAPAASAPAAAPAAPASVEPADEAPAVDGPVGGSGPAAGPDTSSASTSD